jgi:hypothetical protein
MATTNVPFLWNQKSPNVVGVGYASLLPLYDLGKNSTYLLPATTGDILNIVRVPKRCMIGANWAIHCGDLDTGTGLVFTLQLYDGTTAFPLIHQTTVGQAGGVAIPSKGPATETGIGKIIDDKDWYLRLLIDTQATGNQAARFMIQAHYSGWYTPGVITTE